MLRGGRLTTNMGINHGPGLLVITENELQKQVILLQQTVIHVLEDAMYHNRALDPAGLDRLVAATRTARTGSLEALQRQYQRLVALDPPPLPPLPLPAAAAASTPGRRLLLRPPPRMLNPPPTSPSSSTTSSSHSSSSSNNNNYSRKPPKKTSGRDFFCRYSLDLQRESSRPLSRNFAPLPDGLPHLCPACRVPLAVDATDRWDLDIPVRVVVVTTTTTTTKQRHKNTNQENTWERRRFRVPARFVLKCHTPEGDFACALCCGPHDGYAGEVVLCEDPESLVHHVAREHRIGDIENEWDIFPG